MNKLAEAYKKKDIKMFMEDKTSDFCVKSLDGKTATREQVETAVMQRMDRIKSVNYLKIEIGNITVTGDEAVFVTTQKFSRVVTDAGGKDHTVEGSGTTHRDTWVKIKHGWKIKQVEETKQGKVIVDGEQSERP